MNDNKTRIRLIIGITVGIALLAAVSVGVYGLFFTDKDRAPEPPTAPSASSSPAPGKPSGSSSGGITDPECYARFAAGQVFAWDTSVQNRHTVLEELLMLGDPSGEELAGLASDLNRYLPSTEAWQQLRTNQTRQELVIETAEIPETWGQATGNGTAEGLPKGTVAYTITGTRHRTGVYHNQPVEASRPVAFTMFITCAPTFPECHLMRLGQLDNPMK
jgi:hypothetical protein